MGAKSDRTAYKPYGRRQKIGIYCTKAQKIEIELEFEFYRNVFYEELSTFMDAFIQAQKIFPEDAPVPINSSTVTVCLSYFSGISYSLGITAANGCTFMPPLITAAPPAVNR